MRVFLDTNIVIDFFSGRMGDSIAEKIVCIGKSSEYEMCISVLTAANILYVARRHYKTLKSNDLKTLFKILPMTPEQWDMAGELKTDDFEDALQTACAIDAQCNVIVTRDLSHCAGSIVKVYSPEEFLSLVPIKIRKNSFNFERL